MKPNELISSDPNLIILLSCYSYNSSMKFFSCTELYVILVLATQFFCWYKHNTSLKNLPKNSHSFLVHTKTYSKTCTKTTILTPLLTVPLKTNNGAFWVCVFTSHRQFHSFEILWRLVFSYLP